MKAFKSLFIFLILSGSSVGFDDLQLGVETKNTQEMSDSEFIDFTLKTRKAADFGIKGSQVSSFIEVEDRFYALLKNMRLIGMIEQPKEFLGSWPLTRWAHEYLSPLLRRQYHAIDTDFPAFEHRSGGWLNAGCYSETPLRYGDIENDGSAELVLTFGGMVIFFSPEYERIVFSEIILQSDEVGPASVEAYFEGQVFNEAQFLSTLAADNGYPPMPALRFYAKLYLGDFNANGASDILVWRKGFLSRRGNDPVVGFELVEESWTHYERNLEAQALSEIGTTGEYLPQDTAPETIQGWLAANNLTWSKGFPSESECSSAEGELIPEMHDPLLNDPDVLM